jgi:hypothetical protein
MLNWKFETHVLVNCLAFLLVPNFLVPSIMSIFASGSFQNDLSDELLLVNPLSLVSNPYPLILQSLTDQVSKLSNSDLPRLTITLCRSRPYHLSGCSGHHVPLESLSAPKWRASLVLAKEIRESPWRKFNEVIFCTKRFLHHWALADMCMYMLSSVRHQSLMHSKKPRRHIAMFVRIIQAIKTYKLLITTLRQL